MKFLADDDCFGIIVTPTGWRHMYQFRLVIDGRLIGDTHRGGLPVAAYRG